MRLARPSVPVEVKVRVVLRQLGEMWPDEVIMLHRQARSPLAHLLQVRLGVLAGLLQCDVKDLRLDHDPALATRKKLYETPNGGRRWSWQIEKEGRVIRYEPDANDPEHLRYRPHGAQFVGSHHVKTNVRGDGAQHPDRVLIKKLRRKKARRIKRDVTFRAKNKVSARFRSPADKSKPKRKWPTRPLRSANRWPTKRAR